MNLLKNKQVLQKYKNKSTKNNKIIIYADIETIIINKKHYPYAIGWSHNNDFNYSITSREDEIMNYKVIQNFFQKLDSQKKYIVYFHNMSNFDGFIVLNKLIQLNLKVELTERNNIIYNIKINKNINIRDSFLLIPFALKDISKYLCSKHAKLDFPIHLIHLKNIIERKKEIIEYLKEDVLTLQESMDVFSNLILKEYDYNIHHSFSLSSISFNIFRKKFYDINKYPIFKNTRYEEEFLEKAYIGGINEVFKPLLIKGFSYDINSLYPFSMTKDLPIGKGKYIDDLSNIDKDTWFGFAKVIVKAPYQKRPVLPLKVDGKVLLPYGEWCGIYFSEEIKNAEKFGYTFEYLEGYQFNRGPVTKTFSETLYKNRLSYEKEHPMNMIIKLLLNSLYGRFGMKILKTNKKIINIDQFDYYNTTYDIIFSNSLEQDTVFIEYLFKSSINKQKLSQKERLKEYDVNTAIHIAAAITAYSRIHMTQYIINENVYYTDTDSIYTTEKLEGHFIGNQLGQMKLENKILKGVFIVPKTYYFINSLYQKIVKFKGFNANIVNTVKLHEKIFKNDTTYVWKRLSFFKKNFKELEITLSSSEIKNTLDLTKREKVFDCTGKWVDTEPFEIYNMEKVVDIKPKHHQLIIYKN